MADSNIEWTDRVWNPTVGCRRVSAGCENCYAERLAYRLAAMGQFDYQGLTHKLPDGKVHWTGVVRALPERLEVPLKWKRPARIFVDSMSDLFHEDVPDEFLIEVWAVMEQAKQHTFQILTKRPERMLRFLRQWEAQSGYHPPANVWLGVSVEDQRAADERIPLLLQTPAAVRFLSCEPLLGPIDLSHWLDNISNLPPLAGTEWLQPPTTPTGWYQINEFEQPLHWVIAGGESGPGFRPMDLDWARALRDQCQAAAVPFFYKQASGPHHGMFRELDGRMWEQFPDVKGIA